jgi:hypothetical protein
MTLDGGDTNDKLAVLVDLALNAGAQSCGATLQFFVCNMEINQNSSIQASYILTHFGPHVTPYRKASGKGGTCNRSASHEGLAVTAARSAPDCATRVYEPMVVAADEHGMIGFWPCLRISNGPVCRLEAGKMRSDPSCPRGAIDCRLVLVRKVKL